MALNFAGVGEMRALYLAAILNGVTAPALLAVIMLLARDPVVLGEHVAGWPLVVLGWATTATMALAALALLVTSL